MSRTLIIDNYYIDTPLIKIVEHIQRILTNGKLREVQEKADNILVSCPSHSDGLEKKAAGNIYIGDNPDIPYGYYACWVCTFKGPFYKFVAKCFDKSDQYAKNWLIKHYGILRDKAVELGAPICLTKEVKQIKSAELIDIKTLQDYCPYLQSRKLSKETCKFLDIKYDNKNKTIVFPCYNKTGDLIMTPTRSILTKFFKLGKDIEKPLYCIDKIYKYNINKFMLVEGPIDCATTWEHHIPSVAFLGKLSDTQIDAINKIAPKVVYITTDNDEAGNKFAAMLQSKLNNTILKIRVYLPQNRKDVNDLTEDEWQELIKKYNLPVQK